MVKYNLSNINESDETSKIFNNNIKLNKKIKWNIK